jgi:hypothetical protein
MIGRFGISLSTACANLSAGSTRRLFFMLASF